MPGATTAASRVPLIAAACDGALVVSRFWGCRSLVGRAAAAEAQGVADLGLSVLVKVPGRLAAWCDVAAREPDDPRPYWPALELDLPAVPQSPLPTVLASLRALGLPQ